MQPWQRRLSAPYRKWKTPDFMYRKTYDVLSELTDDQDLAQLPEQLVVGRFARHMRERLEEAGTQEERQDIEDALQLGVSLLQGKDVI